MHVCYAHVPLEKEGDVQWGDSEVYKSNGNAVSEIKLFDQRGQRLSGRRSVAGRYRSHQRGAKPLEGVHFWKGNEAKVMEGKCYKKAAVGRKR